MLAVEIQNHIGLALARRMQLWKNVPKNFNITPVSGGGPLPASAFDAILIAHVDQIQLLENALYGMDSARQLYNGTSTPAVGAQLDALGTLVGLARNGLTDSEYIVFLFGQIAEDNSNGTSPVIGSIIALLFGVTNFIYQPLYPAEVFFEIPSSSLLPASLYLTATYIVAASLAAGVSLAFSAVYPAASAFLLSSAGGPNVGGGCGDATNPTVGGGLASVIFTNTSGA